MTKAKLPAFKGKPLIEIPEIIPQIGFLEGDFGKAFLKEYQGRVKSDYNDNSSLDVLRQEGVVKGSNPFVIVLTNQILRKEGLRTATQADLEKALKLDVLPLRGIYEDTGLILRSEDEPNKYLAKNLAEQVKTTVGKTPIVIPLNGLELVNDSNSPHGLIFKLTDESELIYVPILDGKNNGKSFSETGKYGLPEKLGKGNRTLYTRDSGLSRLYLDDDLDLGSDYWRGLDGSYAYGRVVVVSGKGTSQKIKQEGETQ